MSEFGSFCCSPTQEDQLRDSFECEPTICSSICPRGQLPKSPASSSLFDASPNICKIAPRLWLGEFVISNLKRLFRQPRPYRDQGSVFWRGRLF
jgi:hypothetical protein